MAFQSSALLPRVSRASPLIRFLMSFMDMPWTVFPWSVAEPATCLETSLSMEYNGWCLSTLLTTIVALIHGKRRNRCHLHFRDSFQRHVVPTIDRITFYGAHSLHCLCNMMNITHDYCRGPLNEKPVNANSAASPSA